MSPRSYALKEGINRIINDGGSKKITKRTIGIYGVYDWTRIKSDIVEWEARGLLKIVKSLDEAKDHEVVIEMLNSIDQESPWPDWPEKKSV